MPFCRVPLTKLHEEAQALLKERHGLGPYTRLQESDAFDEVQSRLALEQGTPTLPPRVPAR